MMVHVRKAGGSSVKNLILDSTGELENNLFNNGAIAPNCLALISKYPDYYRFAVVRNPYTRFLSSWKYLASTRKSDAVEVLRGLPSRHLLSSILRSNTTFKLKRAYFKEIVRITRQHPPRSKFLHLLGHDYRHITIPQSSFIFSAVAHRTVVHDFFKLEDLAIDPAPLLSKLGLPLHERLPHLNANNSPIECRNYLDEESYSLFHSRFGCDFEKLGYER